MPSAPVPRRGLGLCLVCPGGLRLHLTPVTRLAPLPFPSVKCARGPPRPPARLLVGPAQDNTASPGKCAGPQDGPGLKLKDVWGSDHGNLAWFVGMWKWPRAAPCLPSRRGAETAEQLPGRPGRHTLPLDPLGTRWPAGGVCSGQASLDCPGRTGAQMGRCRSSREGRGQAGRGRLRARWGECVLQILRLESSPRLPV